MTCAYYALLPLSLDVGAAEASGWHYQSIESAGYDETTPDNSCLLVNILLSVETIHPRVYKFLDSLFSRTPSSAIYKLNSIVNTTE